MSIPLDVAADLFAVMDKHGVKVLRHAEVNAMIAALTPCFEPGYPHPSQNTEKEGSP